MKSGLPWVIVGLLITLLAWQNCGGDDLRRQLQAVRDTARAGVAAADRALAFGDSVVGVANTKQATIDSLLAVRTRVLSPRPNPTLPDASTAADLSSAVLRLQEGNDLADIIIAAQRSVNRDLTLAVDTLTDGLKSARRRLATIDTLIPTPRVSIAPPRLTVFAEVSAGSHGALARGGVRYRSAFVELDHRGRVRAGIRLSLR